MSPRYNYRIRPSRDYWVVEYRLWDHSWATVKHGVYDFLWMAKWRVWREVKNDRRRAIRDQKAREIEESRDTIYISP